MDQSTRSLTEGLVFDGALGVPVAIALGAAWLLLITWLMLRDRRALGSGWAALFWALRGVAGVLALWMAVGPMQEKREKISIPQSIAVLADDSESMSVVDPPNPAEDVRWNLAADPDSSANSLLDTAVVRTDRAAVAVTLALQACETTQQWLAEHRALERLEQQLAIVKNATEHAEQHCAEIVKKLSAERGDLADRAARVEELLEDSLSNSIIALEKSFAKRQGAVVADMHVALTGLTDNLTSASRRLQNLSADLLEERGLEGLGDYSASSSPNRLERTRSALRNLELEALTRLPKDVRVNRYLFDTNVTAIADNQSWRPSSEEAEAWKGNPQKQSPCTDLAAVLNEITKSRSQMPVRMAVLYTDGRHNAAEGATPADVATRLTDLPLYIVPLGSSQVVRDVVLHRVNAPSTVVEHDTAIIEAIVTAFDCDGESTELVLRHEGQVVERKEVTFAGERVDRRVTFEVPAEELGWKEYELSVEPLTDEESMANNVAALSWEVVKDAFRVLISDGASRWEFRYLQQLFRRDEHVEADELLFLPRLRGTGRLATNPRLPITADEWAAYDVVILGDLDPRYFPRQSQQALVEYVRQRDGHLMLVAGRNHMPHAYQGLPLFEILPVEPFKGTMYEEYTVQLTDEGRLHSALLIEDGSKVSEYAWMDVYDSTPISGMSQFSQPKSTARTLIHAVPYGAKPAVGLPQKEELPAFLCWHQVGAGNVVYLSAPEIWRLRYRVSDRRHHRFWGQMIRWMTAANAGSGSDAVRLVTDRTHYTVGQPVEATVWLKDQTGRPLAGQEIQVVARVLDKNVSSVPLVPDEQIAGRYAGVLEDLEAGAYEITVEGEAIGQLLSGQGGEVKVRSLITVEANDNLEMMDTRSDRPLLQQLAELTGGQVIPPTAVSEVLELASLSPEVQETVERTPLWNRWSHLWVILGCLFPEWIVRKAKGFV